MNIALSVTPSILGAALDHGGFEATFTLLFLMSLASAVTSAMMIYQDKKYSNSLL